MKERNPLKKMFIFGFVLMGKLAGVWICERGNESAYWLSGIFFFEDFESLGSRRPKNQLFVQNK